MDGLEQEHAARPCARARATLRHRPLERRAVARTRPRSTRARWRRRTRRARASSRPATTSPCSKRTRPDDTSALDSWRAASTVAGEKSTPTTWRAPRCSASQRVTRPVPQPTSTHAPPGHVAERAHEERALPLVPQRVEGVRRPERARHPAARRGARVPVRRDAVERAARAPLLEELPDARASRCRWSSRRRRTRLPSRCVDAMRRARASARAVAWSRVSPWQRTYAARFALSVSGRTRPPTGTNTSASSTPVERARLVEAASPRARRRASRRGTWRWRRRASARPAPCRSSAGSPSGDAEDAVVEVDAAREPRHVRVEAAAEARRRLEEEAAARAEGDLRVAGAARVPERRRAAPRLVDDARLVGAARGPTGTPRRP